MNVKIEQLKLSFQDKIVLDNIAMHVQENKCVGIIGPNGSGKSTLLKCIYRILTPDSGKICMNGIDVKTLSYRQVAQQLAVVAQHHHYNFDFLVKDIVMMGRVPHQKMMQKETDKDYVLVDQVLEKIDMVEYKERFFSTLSGGEQQRVILARALAQEPKCLILDEPTNHLDIKYQLQLMRIVKSLGITVISAIHDLNIAMNFCDELYVLKDAKIIASGAPECILTPQLIEEVYRVRSQILEDSLGQKHIVFLQA
ncbi:MULTISPECIES: ABC transporter ATP-binding protein [unclassified Granulicatella]|uniref:ABC transporter ATP-binding protein n=1 Tax=unclassified Granulicatella TaxID=2630493 RepID=UPI0010737A5B|nr:MULTISPECIES: ABC transporter ATP-binding protein [unclassified Granulicatella]MBF0779745.1 ABC transporter ATP-binding protein [Granulicatella sp. 19428wC4_WM01]TFU96264.1 ABC transporter ATP-binding protein [Granulicatella sp. WM01]